LRLGIIAHLKYPIREPFAGGVEMHTHMLAMQLRRRGHEVVVFASTQSDAALGVEAICPQTTLDEAGLAESQDYEFFREHHAYLTLMNRLRSSNFDVIHNNSLHYLPVAMADALPMPMVTTLHTPPFCWLESGVRLSKPANMKFVAVSRSIEISWAPITPVYRVIPNGIDLGRFAFCPAPAAQPYLVWYGRIVPEKGLHFAIDAARKLGMILQFAGPMVNDEYYQAEIAPRLGPDTVYAGHLAHRELAGLIGGARAFLCTPCWEEPFGLVVAEALACGVPVAAFARGAIPEILDASCGVLAAPDDVVALAAAAAAALKLRRADCRRRAERICDGTTMIDAYEAVYAALTSPVWPEFRAA
jgi:glycosyltransferase involved in cell wall biosynthesis